MVSTAAMTTSSTTPTANLLSHLGRSLDRHTGTALPGHTAAVLLGDLLAVLLGDRGAGLLWCLDWNLLAVFLGYSGALLVTQWLERWCANLAAQVRILAVSIRLSYTRVNPSC